MTANQKRRITLMRQNHVGYAAIANELKLPLSTVKAFCRRNGLQASDKPDCELFLFQLTVLFIILYRQWVKDNKKMPLEDLIATATRLICGGLGEYVTE